MSFSKRTHEILNQNLYDTSDIEVEFFQARLQWPWKRGYVHALGWVYFSLGILAIFAVLNLRDIRIDRRRLGYSLAENNKENQIPQHERSLFDRISTHLRSFTYLRTSRWGLAPTSFGLGSLIFAGFLFPVLYVFTQRPYYLGLPKYGPPPLSGRSGMIALAMTPFILALGMKANFIGFLTGVGHEKLNVLHRWLSFFCAFLSLVHAVPFFVEPAEKGGWSVLRDNFRKHETYWNGVGALVCLFWLCFASLSPIRAYCYEIFVHLHILAGIGYIGLLFWHCNNMLTSWHYLYATIGIWVTSLLYRLIFRSNFLGPRSSLSGELATFSSLTDDGVKITIPTKMHWKAGQHVFIRVPGISLLDNHPFTVASVMADEDDDPNTKLRRARAEQRSAANDYEDKDEKVNDLVLVFKPHKGFTRRAYDISRNHPDTSYRAYLDGPYGGLSRKLEAFETVLMIAGGSGITPIAAHLQDLAQKIKKGKALTRDIRIVWTVKRFESLEWFKDEISIAARSLPRGILLCQYYVTEETPMPLPQGPISATREWPTSPTSGAFPASARVRPLSRAATEEGDRERVRTATSSIVIDPHNLHISIPQQIANQTNPNITHEPPTPTNQSNPTITHEPPTPTYQNNPNITHEPPTPTTELAVEGRAGSSRCPTPLPQLGDEVLLEFGRPPLKDGLVPWAETFGKRTCVYVCGPKSMKVDVANAVASMQSDIWESEDREEVYLHSETFGW